MSFNHSQMVYFAKVTMALYEKHPNDAALLATIERVSLLLYTISQLSGISVDISEYFEQLTIAEQTPELLESEAYYVKKLQGEIKEELGGEALYEITGPDQQEIAKVLYKIYAVEEDDLYTLGLIASLLKAIQENTSSVHESIIELTAMIQDRTAKVEELEKSGSSPVNDHWITMQYPALVQYVLHLLQEAQSIGIEKLTQPDNYDAIRIAERLQYGLDMNTNHGGPRELIWEMTLISWEVDKDTTNRAAWEQLFVLAEKLKETEGK